MDVKHSEIKEKTRPLFAWTRWAVGVMLLIHIGLIAFIWGTADTGNAGLIVMDLVATQQTRTQSLAKNAVILLNAGSSQSAKNEAKAQIKAAYGLFRRIHEGLSKGDVGLRLPTRVPREVLKELIGAQLAYNRISDASVLIIASHDRGEQAPESELARILDHATPYSTSLAQISFLWRENIATVYSAIFWFSVSLAVLDALLIGIFYSLHEFRVYRTQTKKEGNDKEEATVPQTAKSQKSKAVAQDTAESDENKT